MNRITGRCLILLAILLAACGAPQPTAAPSETPMPPPQVATDLPEQPTSAPTATPLERATLPPEWTLTPSATSLEGSASVQPQGTAVPTFDMINAVLLTSPTLEVCSDFTILYDQTETTFNRSNNAHVAWTPVRDALAYRITLYNEARDTVFSVIVGETFTDFGSNLFAFQQRYFWEVRPFDRNGVQLCAAIGAILIPIN